MKDALSYVGNHWIDIVSHFSNLVGLVGGVLGLITWNWARQDRKKKLPQIEVKTEKAYFFSTETDSRVFITLKLHNDGADLTHLRDFDLNFQERLRIDSKQVRNVYAATGTKPISDTQEVALGGGEARKVELFFTLPNTSFTFNPPEFEGELILVFTGATPIHHKVTVKNRERKKPHVPNGTKRKGFVSNW